MNRYISTTIVGVGCILLVSGCSLVSMSAVSDKNQSPSLENVTNRARLNSSQNWIAGDKSFLIQGKIVGIHNKTPYSLRIDFERVIQDGETVSVIPSPKVPAPVGTTITVLFKQPFLNRGPMKPKIGAQVILVIMQYTAGTNETPFWGSARSHYYYHKNGKFYGENGIELGILT